MTKAKTKSKPKDKEIVNYIKINNKKIEDIILQNVSEMLEKTGVIDTNNLITDNIADINLLSMYDEKDNLINYDLKNANSRDYWDKYTEDYIKTLKELLNEDITNITKDELTKKIAYNNKLFITNYMAGILANAHDFADLGEQLNYAKRLTDTLVALQIQEIQKLGYKDFFTNDPSDKINYIIDKDYVLLVRKYILDKILQGKESTEDLKADKIFNITNDNNTSFLISLNNDDTNLTTFLSNELGKLTLLKQKDKVNEIYLKDKSYYDKRHKKRTQINNLLKKIQKKYEKANLSILQEKILEKKTTKNDITREKVNNKITPNYQIIDNRLHKKLTDIENAITQPVNLQLLGKNKDTIINIELNIADTDILGNYLNSFDVLVFNLAFNLYEVGNKQLTPELIYKEYIGKTPSKIGNDIYSEIEKSLHKLIITRLKLTLTPEIISKLKLDEDTIKRLSITDYALPMIESEIEYTNGKIKKGYIYKSEPIYFTFSKLVKQIKTIDRKLLALDTGGSLTKERMLIRQYLSTEYGRIKSTKATDKSRQDRTENKILYSSLFDKCELFKDIDDKINNTTDEKTLKNLQANKRTYKKRYIEEINNIMLYWKNNNFIKDYQEYPKDKKIKQGIEIFL